MATHVAAVVKVCKGDEERQEEAEMDEGPLPLASISDHVHWEGSADAYDGPPPLEHIKLAGSESQPMETALSAAGVSIEYTEDGDVTYVFTSGLNDEQALSEIDQDIAARSLAASAAAAQAMASEGEPIDSLQALAWDSKAKLPGKRPYIGDSRATGYRKGDEKKLLQ